MWTCEECGDKFKHHDGRYEDFRPEPLAEGDCLCMNCFRSACQDAIGFHLSEVERIAGELSFVIGALASETE